MPLLLAHVGVKRLSFTKPVSLCSEISERVYITFSRLCLMNFHRLLRELPTKEQQLSTPNNHDDRQKRLDEPVVIEKEEPCAIDLEFKWLYVEIGKILMNFSSTCVSLNCGFLCKLIFSKVSFEN